MSFLRRSFAQNLSLLVLFFVISQGASAQNILPNGVELVRSSQSELVIRYTPHLEGFDSVQAGGKWMYSPRITGAFFKNPQPGAPAEVIVPVNITVPSPEGFKITSIEAQGVQRFLKEIAPVAKEYSPENIQYIQDQELYSLKTSSWAAAEYKGIAGTRYIGVLKLQAARYDAASRAIEIPRAIVVKIAFQASATPVASAKSFPLSKEFTTTINHIETAQWRIDVHPASFKNTGNTTLGKGAGKQILSSGNWYKLTTETEGIYRIDAATLAASGINVPASEISTIKIFGNGGNELPETISDALKNQLNEQPIIVRTKPGGELDAIIFYGSAASGFDFKGGDFRHFLNAYTFKNNYLLTWGGSAGKRAVESEIPAGAVVNNPTQIVGRVFNEEEMNSPYRIPSGRRWFGSSIDNSLPVTFTTQLPGLLKSGDILYRMNLAHRSKYDGAFTVSENNQNLLKANLSGAGNDEYTDALSNGSVDGRISSQQIGPDNRSVLKFAYAGNSTGTGYIDWFEIHYPRQLMAVNGELEIFGNKGLSGITEYSANGFSGEVVGFDVTDRANPTLLKNAATTGGMFSVREASNPLALKRYFIASAFKTPQIQAVAMSNLREQKITADVILITHPDFLPSAEKYKKYREDQGELSIRIVTTSDIFNEYSYGAPDPTAIRDFLAQAYQNSDKKNRYVILWGDGHYDSRNIATKRTSFVPPYESMDSDGAWRSTVTFSADDYFARIVGNDILPDLALGRIPIGSDDEGEWMVEKISLYESKSAKDQWRTTVTLVADDGPTSHGSDGSQHTNQSEWLSASYIPKDMQQN
ncbi:MAG: C25 family cysteine peptidase, partial [Bacteroidota bacterium]